mgnify:CR=1 FL=1
MQKEQNTLNYSIFIWLRDCWQLAKPFWQSNERWRGYTLIITVIILNLAMVGMTVLINQWYNVFYDAIQNYNKPVFFNSLIKFAILAFIYITLAVLAYYFRKILEIKWRSWMTKYYLERWFKYKAYYKTRFTQVITDNPDQRISEDINSFIVLFLDLSLGLMTSIVSLASFVVILWKISGALDFTLLGHHIIINGYMVWAAVLYAIVGTYITFKIGKPIIKLDFQQQAYEADFRFGLMRVREHAENIAFYNGEAREEKFLVGRFTNVINNFVAIIYRQLKINIFNIGYDQIAIIFPILVSAPRYFAKIIKLGALMQIASAFGKVQDALSYFISAYTTLSGWRAVMDRLCGFNASIDSANQLIGATIVPGSELLKIDNLVINLPNGNKLQGPITLTLKEGERILIRGRSGAGKTTFLRTLAGIWPYFEGQISKLDALNSLFIAQRPYFPIGDLRSAICYPLTNNLPSDDKLNELLIKCQLPHLIDKLAETSDWASQLSLGEQQRVNFCRILVNQPDIIYLDEVTSALDEETEEELYKMLITELPKSLIISVGHRSTIIKWHTQEYNFNNNIS